MEEHGRGEQRRADGEPPSNQQGRAGRDDATMLPPGLPVPQDDGAASHLTGLRVPHLRLPATSGQEVDLAEASRGARVVVYCYPLTSAPGIALPPDWDIIPGARGCTPEACSFRDHYQELRALGADVFGLSTQTTSYQREMATRLSLPFAVLSDARLELTRRLRLPTFELDEAVAGQPRTLLKRLTLVLHDGAVEKVFYPVFPPDRHAEEVMAWLQQNAPPVEG